MTDTVVVCWEEHKSALVCNIISNISRGTWSTEFAVRASNLPFPFSSYHRACSRRTRRELLLQSDKLELQLNCIVTSFT